MKRFPIVPAFLWLLLPCAAPLRAQEPSATPASTPAATPITLETLKAIAGRYATPHDQPATISLHGDHALTATLADGTSYELIPTTGTTFDIQGLGGTSEFRRNADGIYNQVVTSVAGRTFTATRVPEKPAAAPITKETLKLLTGRYAAPGDVTVTIALHGDDALTATLSDGTSYELTPAQGTTFHVNGSAGTAEFRRNADGVYNEVVGSVAAGTYTATRLPAL